jgi:hypothetical protein
VCREAAAAAAAAAGVSMCTYMYTGLTYRYTAYRQQYEDIYVRHTYMNPLYECRIIDSSVSSSGMRR